MNPIILSCGVAILCAGVGLVFLLGCGSINLDDTSFIDPFTCRRILEVHENEQPIRHTQIPEGVDGELRVQLALDNAHSANRQITDQNMARIHALGGLFYNDVDENDPNSLEKRWQRAVAICLGDPDPWLPKDIEPVEVEGIDSLEPGQGGYTTSWMVGKAKAHIDSRIRGTMCVRVWKDHKGEIHWGIIPYWWRERHQ